MHGVWVVWASGGSTRGREYPRSITAQENRRSTIDSCGRMVELGAQDFFYDTRPDGLMRGIRKASTGRQRSANFLGIQRPVDHQLCGDIKNVIVQFWRHTITKKKARVEITQEMWCSSWLCFDISQGRTFCLHSGIGLDSVELA